MPAEQTSLTKKWSNCSRNQCVSPARSCGLAVTSISLPWSAVPARALHRWRYVLAQVHLVKSFGTGRSTFAARVEPLRVPQVGEHSAAAQADAEIEHVLQRLQSWWVECAAALQLLQRAVT